MVTSDEVVYIGLCIAMQGKDYTWFNFTCDFDHHVYFTIWTGQCHIIPIHKPQSVGILTVDFTGRMWPQAAKPWGLMDT